MPTRIHMSSSEDYKAVIRAIHMLPRFDRILLSALYKIPFGTVSRILAELSNEGFVRKTQENAVYSEMWLKRNRDLMGHRMNYGTGGSGQRASVVCIKSQSWPVFLTRWNTFQRTHRVRRAGTPAKFAASAST
jgi:hypothetical protein